MQNPFSLIRHGISYAKFETSETRNKVVELIDALEEAAEELQDQGTELNIGTYASEMQELKDHLLELLKDAEEKIPPENGKERISLGEVTDDADES